MAEPEAAGQRMDAMPKANNERATAARKRQVLKRARRNEALVAQDRASRASFERGELAIPGRQVKAEADARARRA